MTIINIDILSPSECAQRIREEYLISDTVRMIGNTQVEHNMILDRTRILCHIFYSEMCRQQRSLYIPCKYHRYPVNLAGERWK